MPGVLTWYDFLGILPGATPGEVQSAYQARLRLLAPQMLAGAPSKVLKASDAARVATEEAWRVLGDAQTRQRYDEEIGARKTAGGLERPVPVASGPGADPSGRYITPDSVMSAFADLLSADPPPPRRIIVPDLRGLFTRLCLRYAGDLGVRLQMVQLTADPLPVEGLVVEQSRKPGTKMRRAGELTVHVWHPPRRSAGTRALSADGARRPCGSPPGSGAGAGGRRQAVPPPGTV